jgi:hypothetical protein
MELTRTNAYTLMEGIKNLKDYKLNVKTAYTLIKNLKKLEEEFKISEEIRNRLVNNLREHYALKKEDGSFESDNNMFGIKIRKDKLEEAAKEHMDYNIHLNEKINFDIESIDLVDLEGLDINMGLLADLEPIINE